MALAFSVGRNPQKIKQLALAPIYLVGRSLLVARSVSDTKRTKFEYVLTKKVEVKSSCSQKGKETKELLVTTCFINFN